jgi:hypothetical protein
MASLTASASGPHPRLLRQEAQDVHVAWTEEPDVAPVERRQLGLVQPLDQRHHSRVHKADIGVGVAATQLTTPAIP